MAKWVPVVAAVGCAFLPACSPFGGGAFSCERDAQCGAGACTSGYCSFPDPGCDSGFRFGPASSTLSNTCVGSATDASLLDAKTYLDGPPSGVTCFGAGFGKTCFADADVPTVAVTITGPIDTDTSTRCAATVIGAPPWCVIAGTDVTTTGSIAVTGSRPLVLVATGMLTVEAIDIASHLAPPRIGAGAVPTADTTRCDPGTPPGNNGGGAGGSFGTIGGTGGNTGGIPGAIEAPNAMRGGCAGQAGKSGTFGALGLGGGALYLVAQTQIIVNGTINASGAAGSGSTSGKGGGGGGGSGGLIGLDAPFVTNHGQIFANGGGGGEGSSTGTNGFDGKEPTSTASAAASGSHSNGGDGGAGGAVTPAGAGGNAGNDGGGGAGGGAGAVRLFGATTITGNPVSPTAS
ncbi:hypothetical protein BH11MYX1_BH11MYX1_05170 [soil metagenome]